MARISRERGSKPLRAGGTPLRGRLCSYGGVRQCTAYRGARRILTTIAVVPQQAIVHLERIAGRDSALAKKHKVWLQFVGVADYPENYDSRLTTLPLGLKKVTLRTFDPYDLMLSKLTRNSDKDMEDVRALAQKLNLKFDVLMRRFQT